MGLNLHCIEAPYIDFSVYGDVKGTIYHGHWINKCLLGIAILTIVCHIDSFYSNVIGLMYKNYNY